MTASSGSEPPDMPRREGLRSCFVIGTDVRVGKTLVASAIVHLLRTHGIHTVGMKPVAAGAILRHGQWQQDELEQLAAAGSFALPGRTLSPYIFPQAQAPHIAAEMAGVGMLLDEMVDSFDVLATWADVVVVDGVGGFRVPLAANFDSADLAAALKLPLILVVGIKPGCMNHALLTVEALDARGLVLAGWVANEIDGGLPDSARLVGALRSRITAPCLAQIPHTVMPKHSSIAARLSIDTVLAVLRP